MAQRQYIVRDGFVVNHSVALPNGKTFEKTYVGGDIVTFEDEQHALHAHKLELADEDERDAAHQAELKARVQQHARSAPEQLVSTLVEALAHALNSGRQAAEAADTSSAVDPGQG